MNETCMKHALNMPDMNTCPYCEIDRLKEYEDAITSAVKGKVLVYNLMETNCTVIRSDYWQAHLEEIDRLEVELEEAHEELAISIKERINLGGQLAEARAEIDHIKQVEFPKRIERLRAEARQEAARTIERHLLGMFWCIPSKENEPMIYRDQAIEWLRGYFKLEVK